MDKEIKVSIEKNIYEQDKIVFTLEDYNEIYIVKGYYSDDLILQEVGGNMIMLRKDLLKKMIPYLESYLKGDLI
jgi:hypothetical protein